MFIGIIGNHYRKGHLFQDRYKSETVENDAYLFAVLRYIHQNPVKAGLCKNIDEYKFSSYCAYIDKDSSLVDVDFILSMMDKEQFKNFNHGQNENKYLDIDESVFRINDHDAKIMLENVSKCKNSNEFQELGIEKRDQ